MSARTKFLVEYWVMEKKRVIVCAVDQDEARQEAVTKRKVVLTAEPVWLSVEEESRLTEEGVPVL